MQYTKEKNLVKNTRGIDLSKLSPIISRNLSYKDLIAKKGRK